MDSPKRTRRNLKGYCSKSFCFYYYFHFFPVTSYTTSVVGVEMGVRRQYSIGANNLMLFYFTLHPADMYPKVNNIHNIAFSRLHCLTLLLLSPTAEFGVIALGSTFWGICWLSFFGLNSFSHLYHLSRHCSASTGLMGGGLNAFSHLHRCSKIGWLFCVFHVLETCS